MRIMDLSTTVIENDIENLTNLFNERLSLAKVSDSRTVEYFVALHVRYYVFECR